MVKKLELDLEQLYKPIPDNIIRPNPVHSGLKPAITETYVDDYSDQENDRLAGIVDPFESASKVQAQVLGPFNSSNLIRPDKTPAGPRLKSRYTMLFEHSDRLMETKSDPVLDLVSQRLEIISKPSTLTILEIPRESAYYDSLMFLLLNFSRATSGREIMIHLVGSELPAKKGSEAEKMSPSQKMNYYFRRFFRNSIGIYPPPSLDSEEIVLDGQDRLHYQIKGDHHRRINYFPRIIFGQGQLYKLVSDVQTNFDRKITLITADRPDDELFEELQFMAQLRKKSVLIIRPADISQPRFVSPAKLNAAERKIIFEEEMQRRRISGGESRRLSLPGPYEKFLRGIGREFTGEEISRLQEELLKMQQFFEQKLWYIEQGEMDKKKLNSNITLLKFFRALLEQREQATNASLSDAVDVARPQTVKLLKKIIQKCNENQPLDNGLPSLYGLINAQESQSRDIVPDTTD